VKTLGLVDDITSRDYAAGINLKVII
jgi:hypothetical protein